MILCVILNILGLFLLNKRADVMRENFVTGKMCVVCLVASKNKQECVGANPFVVHSHYLFFREGKHHGGGGAYIQQQGTAFTGCMEVCVGLTPTL